MPDLNEDNGWIPEPVANFVLSPGYEPSAVEDVARRVRMSAPTVTVPRYAGSGVDVVPEHGVIPYVEGALDTVVLQAVKFANRDWVSVEDSRDAITDYLTQSKAAWISRFHKKLDNACLGTTGAQNGTTVPFESVYRAAGAGNRTSTAGNLNYEGLVDAFGDLETTNYSGGLVVIAHPAFAMELRNLKDAAGDRVVGDPLGAGVPTIFGHEIRFSKGAVTSATASDNPTGNPLLIVGFREQLMLGVLDGPESQVSDAPRWDTDEIELKMRARRGFVVADGNAFRVIEKTAAA